MVRSFGSNEMGEIKIGGKGVSSVDPIFKANKYVRNCDILYLILKSTALSSDTGAILDHLWHENLNFRI